ncbi:hypothetical protein [Sphingomonas sp. OTU376]|uniref:hypothetical protein n=1 Tax=Sphingomonas sp. OTU376 TaxID=3043863 RepID=UPI00313C0D06
MEERPSAEAAFGGFDNPQAAFDPDRTLTGDLSELWAPARSKRHEQGEAGCGFVASEVKLLSVDARSMITHAAGLMDAAR